MDAQQSNQNHQAYQPQIPLENLDQDNQMMTDYFNKCIADYKSIFGQMDNIFMEVWDNTDEIDNDKLIENKELIQDANGMSEFSVTLNNEKEEKDNKIMSQVNILKEGIGRNENENEEIKKATEEAQKELQELEGVVKTETWITEQLKSEELLKMDKLCVSLKIPAEQYLNYFFLVTGTTFGKTPEGNLRIDIGKEERGSKFYLILQLQKGQYKILDSSTHFNPEKYEELLNSAKNFTMFICSVVANEYYSLVRGNA